MVHLLSRHRSRHLRRRTSTTDTLDAGDFDAQQVKRKAITVSWHQQPQHEDEELEFDPSVASCHVVLKPATSRLAANSSPRGLVGLHDRASSRSGIISKNKRCSSNSTTIASCHDEEDPEEDPKEQEEQEQEREEERGEDRPLVQELVVDNPQDENHVSVESTTDSIVVHPAAPTKSKFSLDSLLRFSRVKEPLRKLKLKATATRANSSLDGGSHSAAATGTPSAFSKVLKLRKSDLGIQVAIPSASDASSGALMALGGTRHLPKTISQWDSTLALTVDSPVSRTLNNRSRLGYELVRALPIHDVRFLCSTNDPTALAATSRAIQQLLRRHLFELRATKWAMYLLNLVRKARMLRQISKSTALGWRFAIVAYARHESDLRVKQNEDKDKKLCKKMMDFRLAMQCLCGISVLKFGRKGKPHWSHLFLENGNTLRWTSKHRLGSSSSHGVPLASVTSIRLGGEVSTSDGCARGQHQQPTTEVLVRALQKGMLEPQELRFTLSLVTPTRSFDIKTQSLQERDWLARSLELLVQCAKEYELESSKHVELGIIKKMESINVWKHGRRGRPHKTKLLINRFGEVSWIGRSRDTILLRDVLRVEEGLKTQVFARANKQHFHSPTTCGGLGGVGRGRGHGVSLGSGVGVVRRGVSSSHLTGAGIGVAMGSGGSNSSSNSSCDPKRCFSLVTCVRTLDIETESESVRDWFVIAFRYLMQKVDEKEQEARRLKEEKSLRMLQEICRATKDCDLMLQGD